MFDNCPYIGAKHLLYNVRIISTKKSNSILLVFQRRVLNHCTPHCKASMDTTDKHQEAPQNRSLQKTWSLCLIIALSLKVSYIGRICKKTVSIQVRFVIKNIGLVKLILFQLSLSNGQLLSPTHNGQNHQYSVSSLDRPVGATLYERAPTGTLYSSITK